MKVTIRKRPDGFEAYVAKKDMEEKIVAMEKEGLWGGWVKLANGWTFEMPDNDPETRLPITVEARKISGGED
ncbi:putative nitrogen fixation protein NifT [Rhodospirillum rubrum]|uniref:NifT/FixU n=1 Tax=Rhodospirillum rubrum (strain ATCC 11170 / ATH 1.1.1 / DSM 467 / LMG 4362 / NCIMB 8255 / S1) TaxID=269796 RepID=Q2RVP6_RHORT|nr:putative nitrogen fixation protein NifT [Rhodospirillum rubrum]ABC21799.1 NifT/FixU [Rhodospirillum rubrum ATCC 11170]AEO47499.1 NifT/FixU [Rhodospirillum rubrum F11]MBK1664708.1 putative nitrogen fixation protein NifT [Rhodospirillum rubrum]MBK1676536.1 putative nitrogen fixation protein NifT [Rhodospirillum rubrum]MBK5953356.1 putative nitrogen fixation protein NifT [Rhodospirillum rubrum]